MDVCKVVRQLKTLASDGHNRETIVKDQGCLPGLVLFLDNDNEEVVLLALETLQLLSECSSNRPIMKEELGMMVSLEALVNRPSYNSRVQQLAKELQRTLTSNPLKESQNRSTNKIKQTPSKNRQGNSTSQYRYGGRRKGKNIILQIIGFQDKSCRKVCEDELLKVKGVFSFTFDIHTKRFHLRTKLELRPEVLVAAIARTKTMTAEQIVKNEFGEEVVLSFGANPASANKENVSLPDYLPEDDSPIKGADKAVTIHGKEQNQQGSGWLSAAATFISTSFYW